MNIIIENNYCTLSKDTPSDLIHKIADYEVGSFTKAWDPNIHRFRPTYIVRTKSFFDYNSYILPTGIIGKLVELLEEKGYKVTLEDYRTKPTKLFDFTLKNLSLRDYQQESANSLLSSTRGFIKIPTRGGKTEVLIYCVANLGVKTLIIESSLELLTQTTERFRKYLPEVHIGVIGDSEWNPKDITVSTVQTLHVRRESKEVQDLLQSIQCICIDECHHISSTIKLSKANKVTGKKKVLGYKENSWYTLVQSSNAYYRFGFSATPGKEDSEERLHLEAATGRGQYEISITKLAELGYIVPPKVIVYSYESKDFKDECPVCKKVTIFKKDRIHFKCEFCKYDPFPKWHNAMSKLIVENDERNKLIASIANRYADENKSVLVVVERIEHGKILNSLIKNSIFCFGSSKKTERKEALRDFKNKTCPVLIGTIYGEGVDLPAMEVVILAAPYAAEESSRKLVQALGRVLTKSTGKTQAIVIDFKDEGKFIGKWYNQRKLLYESEEAFKIEYIKNT